MQRKLSVATILVALVFSGCSRRRQFTASDLEKMVWNRSFEVVLPRSLSDDDTLLLELVGEKGVVDSRSLGKGYGEIKRLSLFMDATDAKNPKFSCLATNYLADKRLAMDLKWDLGKTEVSRDQLKTYAQTGEIFVFCGSGASAGNPLKLSGDDLGIRLVVMDR